jgi:hypothetical protein
VVNPGFCVGEFCVYMYNRQPVKTVDGF